MIIIMRLQKKSNICIRTSLNEDAVLTTNVFEDQVLSVNSHFTHNVSNIERHTEMLHFSTQTGEIYIF